MTQKTTIDPRNVILWFQCPKCKTVSFMNIPQFIGWVIDGGQMTDCQNLCNVPQRLIKVELTDDWKQK